MAEQGFVTLGVRLHRVRAERGAPRDTDNPERKARDIQAAVTLVGPRFASMASIDWLTFFYDQPSRVDASVASDTTAHFADHL